MKNWTVYLLFFLLAIGGCKSLDKKESIRVAVAASLQPPLEEIVQVYRAKTGKEIQLITASSGVLTAQIRMGAPFHVFLSANMKYPESLQEEGLTEGSPEVLAMGKGAFWTKNKMSSVSIEQWLLHDAVQTVAIANTRLAPYGQFARAWLEQKGIWEKIQDKLVYGESIGQVNQYIYSGSVDAAFTAVSASKGKEIKDKGEWYELKNTETANVPQGKALIKDAPPAAKAFYDFLDSSDAREILNKYGYE